MTIEEVDALLRALPLFLNLEVLEIVSKDLNSSKLLELGSVICTKKNLKTFFLSILNSTKLGDFLDILDTASSLEHLVLKMFQSDDSMREHLQQFIKSSKRLPSLTLNFWFVPFSISGATSLMDALEGNSSFLRFVLACHECKPFQDSADRLNEIIANHPFLESALFYSIYERLEVMKPLSSERRIDGHHLIRQCRLLASCRAKERVKIPLPFELIEKIFVDSSVKSDVWDRKKLRVIVRCLLSKRSIGKISRYFAFSAESLYWACKRAEELV